MISEEHIKHSNVSLKQGISSVVKALVPLYKGNWILDVGCNTGMFVQSFLEEFPESSILGFEPVKVYYQYASALFKNNANVYLENYALGDFDGSGTIYVAQENIGWNTLIKEKTDGDNSQTEEQISVISFDKYLDYTGLDSVIFDVVKIDTEGYEFKVINGMKHFLKKQKPAIICEVAWGSEHPYWKEELEAFEFLFSIGYKTDVRDQILNLKSTTDILFMV